MHPANVRRVVTMLGATLPFILYSWSSPAVQADGIPQTPIPGTAAAIEWDLPGQIDTLPGAILVDLVGDVNRIWFVTRVATPSVYRVDLKSGKKVSNAPWLSWQLDATQGLSSGLRRIKASKDRRFVFVRTTVSLQRIDTGMCKTSGPAMTTCQRTVWNNELTTPPDTVPDNQSPFAGSDIALDDYNNVYAAVSAVDTPGGDPNPQKSFIERVNPNSASSNVTRWYVGGGAGFCASAGLSAPCLSGVAITSRAKDLVYYSEPQGGPDGMGALAELDPVRNTVRRWTFANLNRNSTDPASEPRQVQFDSDGVLWAVTGSGHLVSLDPKRNRMSKHGTPGHSPFLTDPFGVAPDNGVIGYTDTNDVQNNVAMLIPPRNFFVTVYPDAPVYVVRKTFSNEGIPGDAVQSSGFAKPTPKKLDTLTTRTAEGTFVEAVTNSGGSDSLNPTGITPDRSASVGTFFYAIGTNSTGIDRFGRIRLPRGKEHARIERDDDDRDDDGKRADVDDDNDDDGIKNAFDTDQDNDGTPDMTDDDDDDDGIEDSFDTPDHKETRQTSDQDVAAGDYALDQFTLNPGTLLAVVSAISSNVLAPVSVEVLNEAGQVVASSLASPGAAVLTWTPPAAGGVFTLRVKNQAATPGTISTKILSRELWPL